MSELSRKKILVVDDFANMRSTLKQMLLSVGVEDIDMAASGKEAVDLIAKKPYDIVLCDYNLGEGKDGQQVLEEVKQRRLLRYSAIFVMITAENAMDMVLGAMEYKPDDYLTKPFTKELLRKRLERQLERKADFDAIERAVQKREYLRAIELCDERIAAKPRNVGEFIRVKADLCLSAGRYADAEAICAAVTAERNVPWAQLVLGQVRFHQGHFEEAKEIFRNLVTQNQTLMEAHDWFARALVKLGEWAEAEEVLSKASSISPKAILRQRLLGDVAVRNEHLDVAERAYRKTVSLGRDSVFRNPVHYTALSKVLVRTSSPLDALKTLESMRREFRGQDGAMLQAALAEGEVFSQLGRETEAKQALQEAAALYGGGVRGDAGLAIEMARAYVTLGEKEKGLAVLQDLVRNHHEDDELLLEAQGAFNQLGLAKEAEQLINVTRERVVALNNQGVNMVREGRFEEANKFFEQAAKEMPDNRTVNLNAAQALLMAMQKNGRTEAGLSRARGYLERVRRMAPADETMHRLWAIYEKITG